MIAFNKYYNKFNILSVSLVIVSLLLLTFKGLNFGIDFKGGTLIELRSTDSKINVSSLRDNLSQMNLGLLKEPFLKLLNLRSIQSFSLSLKS